MGGASAPACVSLCPPPLASCFHRGLAPERPCSPRPHLCTVVWLSSWSWFRLCSGLLARGSLMLSRMLCPSSSASLMSSCGESTALRTPGPPTPQDSDQAGESGGLCGASPPRWEWARWAQRKVFLPSVLTARPRGKQAGVGETPPAATRAELGLRVTQGQQDKVRE